ncbi:MAG: hypothetical protein IPO22_02620 [Anaerolineales bacterium]|nr:hypothetical protein [Anaerolineales bacterium]
MPIEDTRITWARDLAVALAYPKQRFQMNHRNDPIGPFICCANSGKHARMELRHMDEEGLAERKTPLPIEWFLS